MALVMSVVVDGENQYEFGVLDNGEFSLSVKSLYDTTEFYTYDTRVSGRNLTDAMEQVAATLETDAASIRDAVKALAKVTE